MIFTENEIDFHVDDVLKRATIIDCHLKAEAIFVPEKIGEYTVRSIDVAAFRNNKQLTFIKLPNTITKIREEAFRGCIALEQVSFYETEKKYAVLKISDKAFMNCHSLFAFEINDSTNVSIGREAFKNCSQLLDMHGCIQNIENKGFENCFKLNTLTFADCVLWKTDTFKGCHDLKNLIFDGDVEELMSDTCMKWISKRNIKCPRNSSLADFVYEGTHVEFIK